MTADISIIDDPNRKAFRAETDAGKAWVAKTIGTNFPWLRDDDGWVATSPQALYWVRIEAEAAFLSVEDAE